MAGLGKGCGQDSVANPCVCAHSCATALHPVENPVRYSDFYGASPHPRRSAETRRIAGDAVHLTRIRQGAHGLDDPATDELIAGVVLGGVTRCRWTWGDGWNETAGRRAGDIGLTPPQSGGTFEVDGDHEILVMGLSLRTLKARGLIGEEGARPFGRLHDAYHRDAAGFGLCRRLWALGGTGGDAAAMEAETLTGLLIARWRDMADRTPPVARRVRPLDQVVFEEIRQRVEDEPGARHRLSDWAARAGMTGPAFSAAFKARAGVPPHRYLLEARIGIAERLLAGPGSDIEEIAEVLGFDSRSHLARVFTRLRGRSLRG